MRAFISIVALAALIAGCEGAGKGGPISPDRQFDAKLPVRPAPAARSESQPAPASMAAARPTTEPYRLVAQPVVVSAGMLQVNDTFISLPTVLDPLRDELTVLGSRSVSEDAFRREAVAAIRKETDSQIQHALLLAEAERRLEDADKKAIEEEIAKSYREALAGCDGSRIVLDERLRMQGTSLDKWYKDMSEAVKVQHYIRGRIQPRIMVTRTMM